MRKRRPTLRSEDYLDRIEAVTITLEDGERVKLRVRPEVTIPEDPVKMERAARRAPARLAFWAYQTEIALSRVRKAELALGQVQGLEYEIHRRDLMENQGRVVTEPMLRASLDHRSPQIRAAMIALNARRREYGVLRSIRDAVDHRAWTMRTLLKKPES